MDFSSVCRTCLRDKSLKPIFEDHEDCEGFSSAILIATGVKVQLNDGLPQNMCAQCANFINNSLKFRKQCQNAQDKLYKIKSDLETSENMTKVLDNSRSTQNVNDKEICIQIEIVSENKCYSDDKTDIQAFDSISEVNIKLEEHYGIEQITTCDIVNEYNTSKISNQTPNDKENTIESHNITRKTHKRKKTIIHTDSDLLYSIIPENQSNNQRVMCKLCQKELSIRSVDSHMSRRHPGADDRRIKCSLCDAYVLKEKLKRHRTLMHGGDCFRCAYCKTEFGSESTLQSHAGTCTEKTKKRKVSIRARELVECPVCQVRLQRGSLRAHTAVKHGGLRPVCEHCGKSFGNKRRLAEHARARHGAARLRCALCPFTSANIVALRNHTRRHGGEKPFVCGACGAAFHAQYLLTQHTHSHRTHRPHQCGECGARFKANNGLHMHRRACHSKHTYSCGECGRSFSSRVYVTRHARTHAHKRTADVQVIPET